MIVKYKSHMHTNTTQTHTHCCNQHPIPTSGQRQRPQSQGDYVSFAVDIDNTHDWGRLLGGDYDSSKRLACACAPAVQHFSFMFFISMGVFVSLCVFGVYPPSCGWRVDMPPERRQRRRDLHPIERAVNCFFGLLQRTFREPSSHLLSCDTYIYPCINLYSAQ